MNQSMIYETENACMSVEFMYEYGGYYTYKICVSSSGFAGVYTFSIFDEQLKKVLHDIDMMLTDLSGMLEIKDTESDAFLHFYFEDALHFYVTGQLGGSWNDNVLKFKTKADQTLLGGLKRQLAAYG